MSKKKNILIVSLIFLLAVAGALFWRYSKIPETTLRDEEIIVEFNQNAQTGGIKIMGTLTMEEITALNGGEEPILNESPDSYGDGNNPFYSIEKDGMLIYVNQMGTVFSMRLGTRAHSLFGVKVRDKIRPAKKIMRKNGYEEFLCSHGAHLFRKGHVVIRLDEYSRERYQGLIGSVDASFVKDFSMWGIK